MQHRSQLVRTVLLGVLVVGAVRASAAASRGPIAVPGTMEKKLSASSGAVRDAFGSAVSVSGNTAVVGVPKADGTAADSGMVYVYYRNRGGPNAWGEVKRLTASDAAAGDEFGASVAVSGEIVIVGAPHKDGAKGAVYVFGRHYGGRDNWGQVKKLAASDGAARHRFGAALALSDEIAVVGASGNPGAGGGGVAAGAAYVFGRNQGGWSRWGEIKKLTASDAGQPGAPRQFGTSVSISGRSAVVGAVAASVSGSAGAAYVFGRDRGGANRWSQVKRIAGAAGDDFAGSVAISGRTLVVGAARTGARGRDAGAAYVFDRDRGGADNWGVVQRLLARDARAGDRLGSAVAISGDLVAVGARIRGRAGAAYTFSRHYGGPDNFGQVRKFVASDGTGDDRFGDSVAVRDGTLIAGAPGATIGGNVGQGAAYAYDLALGAWSDRGHALRGIHGSPKLVGRGRLDGGSTLTLTLSNARARTTAYLAVGVSAANVPLFGGTLVPEPALIQPLAIGGTTGVPARISTRLAIPGGVPTGVSLYFQHWIADGAGPYGFAASNAVLGTTQTSMFREMVGDFDALLRRAAPPATSLRIYTKQDFATRSFMRNPNCWAAGIDLTGLSPWNQTGANRRAGTLVSPRHIVFARHYRLQTTAGKNELVFVTQNNVTVTRKLVRVVFPAADIGVGLLDADVPVTIKFYKVLGKNWSNYLRTTGTLPMLHLDQEEKALVRDMNPLSQKATYSWHRLAASTLRRPFSETLIGGDSGNPAFLVVRGEAILILTHHYATAGPFYTGYYDQVNTAMTQLGGGYQLTGLDLAIRAP